MRNEPTFYQGMDWYGLVELGPAAREVLNLMLTSCRPGRNGHVEHSVHVMATWFPEVTRHWKTPMTASKARRGLGELIEKGVLVRHNDSKDGSGFMVTFSMNPPQHSDVPVNGFRHAEEVAERCGARAVFRRIGDGGDKRASRDREPRLTEGASQVDPFSEKAPTAPDQGEEPDHEFDLSGLDRLGSGAPSELTGQEAEFAAELEEITSRNTEPRLRLMTGTCRRIAEEVRPHLESGWRPRELARRLSSELNVRIHSPEKFLMTKAKDLGSPPQARVQKADDPQPVQADGFVPEPGGMHIPRREGRIKVDAEDQEKVAELARAYAASKNRSRR